MYSLSRPFLPDYPPFQYFIYLIYYQNIKLIYSQGDGWMKTTALDSKKCDYCSGNGYFQLLLGGSETCTCCSGSGKKKE
jgi:DnaJ-class molecular chaperone